MQKNAPIGLIDSGVGGFSILSKLQKEFSTQDFVYLCDEKNFPYSEKSIAELQEIANSAVEKLTKAGCRIIVLACNTLTVTALEYLRKYYPEHTFIGTVPAVKPAAEQLPDGAHIVVLATKNTAESEYLQKLVQPYTNHSFFSLVGTTRLVEAIENWNEAACITELTSLLQPLHNQKAILGVVLGCTHFAFVERQIQTVLASPIVFFEPSVGIAKQLTKVLADQSAITTSAAHPTILFLSTNPSTTSLELAKRYSFLISQRA